jgi:hypothetical protein
VIIILKLDCEHYVKGKITRDTRNVTSQEKTVIDGEEAIKVYHLNVGDYSFTCFSFIILNV